MRIRKNLQLAQFLNARILHDLAGAIGAVDNSLSLIGTSSKEISRQAKSLAIEESGNLVKRLNILRASYTYSDLGEQSSIIYLIKVLKDFFSISKKIKLDLEFEGGILYLDAKLAKAALCLVMISSEKIYFSGKVDLFCSRDKENTSIRIIANAAKNLLATNDSIKVFTTDKITSQIDIQNCREYYINELCKSIGYKVTANIKDKTLELHLLSQ